ncbi:MAG: hypothetical protein J7K23_09495 [Thermoproteales archaeon]|nr:hypothetical protein [Thermoproteales archaeon]
MVYPYPYYDPRYPYTIFPPLFDPYALLYLYMQYITTIYYLEMYKLMIEMWKKYMETGFKTLTPTQP